MRGRRTRVGLVDRARRRGARCGAVGIVVAIAIVAGLALVSPAGATDGSFICARSVVMLGDSPADVLSRCGPPTQRQGGAARAGASKRARSPAGGLPASGHGRRGEEIWLYDFGSRQLVRVLYFVGGRLARIEVGGYGGR